MQLDWKMNVKYLSSGIKTKQDCNRPTDAFFFGAHVSVVDEYSEN